MDDLILIWLVFVVIGALVLVPIYISLFGKSTQSILMAIFILPAASVPIFIMIMALHSLVPTLIIYIIGMLLILFRRPEWNRTKILAITFLAATLPLIMGFGIDRLLAMGQWKARQSEAKTNLASIATAEISYFAEHGTYSDDFRIVGWEPEGRTKYSYFLSGNNSPEKMFRATWRKTNPPKSWFVMSDLRPPYQRFIKLCYGHERAENEDDLLRETILKTGIGASVDDFTAIAIGDIDGDYALDVWIVNKEKDPHNIRNDVNDSGDDKLERDFFFIAFQSHEITFYPDRLAGLLLAANFILWMIFMSYVSAKSKD